jgi:hypothetical protein
MMQDQKYDWSLLLIDIGKNCGIARIEALGCFTDPLTVDVAESLSLKK